MKKTKKTKEKRTAKKRGSFAKALKNHLETLEKQTRKKRGGLERLMKKETGLENKINHALGKLIETETKKLSKAKKNRDKGQNKLQANLKAFKKRHQEFLRKSRAVERLRSRQKALQQRIEKMKKTISKQAPMVKIEQQKEMQKKIEEMPTIASEPEMPAEEEEPRPETASTQEMEIEHETEEPSVSETTEEEPLQPAEDETREEWEPEPVSAEEPETGMEEPFGTEEGTPSEPAIEPGFKQFTSDGVSFIHPDWPEALTKSVGSIFSIEMDQIRFELFSYTADSRLGLDQNVQKALQSIPDLEIVSQENINHYMFVTYLVTEGENLVKHYALFAQVENQLYKIEANGDPDKLDEQSALIVKVFKSFAVEENE